MPAIGNTSRRMWLATSLRAAHDRQRGGSEAEGDTLQAMISTVFDRTADEMPPETPVKSRGKRYRLTVALPDRAGCMTAAFGRLAGYEVREVNR